MRDPVNLAFDAYELECERNYQRDLDAAAAKADADRKEVAVVRYSTSVLRAADTWARGAV